MHTIALLPPDERPNTAGFAVTIGECFGMRVVLPPPGIMPSFMTPADTDKVAEWIKEVAQDANEALISLDFLVHGGLIPSRNTHDTLLDVLNRLAPLQELEIPVTGYQVVQRMPPYNNSTRSRQEPAYWSEHGADLGRFSKTWHEFAKGEATREDLDDARDAIPEEYLRDAMWRRLRNHMVNLAALDLAARGVFKTLVITSDDTSPRSLPAADRHAVEGWIDRLGLPVLTYPGADEVPSVLTARIGLSLLGKSPRVAFVSHEGDEGLSRTPPFEDGPVREGLLRQVRAAGAQLASDPGEADLVVVVHAPDPDRQIWGSKPPQEDTTELCRGTARLAGRYLAMGKPVTIADVKYANGGDPRLITALDEEGILLSLASYSGWNTAGNTIGTALAAGLAHVACPDPDARAAQRAFLVRKIVEDGWYLPVVRLAIQREALDNGLSDPPLEDIPTVEKRIASDLQDWMSSVPSLSGWRVESATLPWRYTFTVDLRLCQEDARRAVPPGRSDPGTMGG